MATPDHGAMAHKMKRSSNFTLLLWFFIYLSLVISLYMALMAGLQRSIWNHALHASYMASFWGHKTWRYPPLASPPPSQMPLLLASIISCPTTPWPKTMIVCVFFFFFIVFYVHVSLTTAAACFEFRRRFPFSFAKQKRNELFLFFPFFTLGNNAWRVVNCSGETRVVRRQGTAWHGMVLNSGPKEACVALCLVCCGGRTSWSGISSRDEDIT